MIYTMATEVISSELSVQMVKLRQMLENSLDEGTGKVMANVKIRFSCYASSSGHLNSSVEKRGVLNAGR